MTAAAYPFAPTAERSVPVRTQARRAGWLYFAALCTSPFALLYVPRSILVSGNPTATADRIRDARWLLELGIATELLNCSLVVLALLALYRLFRGVSQPLAIAMVLLFLVSVPLQLANLLTHVAALMVTSGTPTLAAFSKEQLDALAYMFERLHARGIDLTQIYWGLWLIPYGLVVIRSRFIPAWLGVPLIVAGTAYVAASVTSLFFPAYARTLSPMLLALGIGEIPIQVWLIGWGARRETTQMPTA